MPTIAIFFFATNILSLLIGVAFGRMVAWANIVDELSKMSGSQMLESTNERAQREQAALYAAQCAQQGDAQLVQRPLSRPMHTHFDL